jgi:hypothetical protein
MSERDQLSRQIERLVKSHVLHSSESLCKLLRYLAKQTLDHPGIPVKEYQIATEVFGRQADFDPQSDSTIRVQAGRLRAKLAEYYSSEGADDPVVVELPKGTYVLSFRPRTVTIGRHHPNATNEVGLEAAPSARKWIAVVIALSLLLTASAVVIAGLWVSRKPPETAQTDSSETAPAALQAFWKPFLAGPEEPWVVFSNAAFVGRPETGMRYYNPARDTRGLIWDHYTGVGEVLAVHNLDLIFGLLHRRLRVRRGSLFALDDAKSNNLIFLGSPSENLTLLDIPSTREFVFQRMTSGPRKGDLAIVNRHPQPGEAEAFLASPSDSPLTEDYSVIGLVPGLNSNRSVLILAGTTTFGTQAAVEYVCRQSSLEELLFKLSGSRTGEPRPFEALLRTKVKRGVPVETELLAVRKR